jgi:hypothetical protein
MSNVFIVSDGKSYPIGGESPKAEKPKKTEPIPQAATDDRAQAKKDVAATVMSIDERLCSLQEELKVIRNSLHEASPYLKRAVDTDGQTKVDGGDS